MTQKELEEYFMSIKYGTHEWYLYHHIRNEDPIIPLILLSCFLVICYQGIPTIIFIWTIYFLWAKKNNNELNHDPEVLKSRVTYMNIYLRNKK